MQRVDGIFPTFGARSGSCCARRSALWRATVIVVWVGLMRPNRRAPGRPTCSRSFRDPPFTVGSLSLFIAPTMLAVDAVVLAAGVLSCATRDREIPLTTLCGNLATILERTAHRSAKNKTDTSAGVSVVAGARVGRDRHSLAVPI